MWKHLFFIAPFFLYIQAFANEYVVQDIAVDFTAESAVLAQSQAFEQGEMSAFWSLMQRMVAPTDIVHLPPITKEEIKSFITSFIVQEEKRSDVRYIATLKYVFNSNAIKDYLNFHNISFSESLACPVLVIPVLKLPQENDVISSTWKQIKDTIDLKSYNLPFVMHFDLPEKEIEIGTNGTTEYLLNLGKHYKASSIAVVHITVQQSLTSEDNLTASIDIYPSIKEQPEHIIQLAAQEFSKNEALPNLTDIIHQSLQEIRKEKLVQKVTDQSAVMENVEIIIPTKTLNQWHKSLQKLQGIPGLLIRKIKSISNNNAHIISQVNDLSQVSQRLLQNGFQVECYKNYLILRSSHDNTKLA